MRRLTFDLDVLRTFVTGVELGSFAKAADRLGRSTSAVSAQLKKLEEQVGAPVLLKSGRGLVPAPTGEVLLAYARRLLELNDEAAHAVRDADLKGEVRLGVQEDFGEDLLTRVLGGFARAHPRVRVQARLARNAELLDELGRGRLDLALAWDGGVATPHARRIGSLEMQWIGRPGYSPVTAEDEAVPLAVLDAPCLMRSTAMSALERVGIPWRIAFTSPGLSGVWAAVGAGLGITVRTQAGLPLSLATVEGLPGLPAIGLDLHRAGPDPSPAVARLESLLQAHLREMLPPTREPAGAGK